jgi:Glyoxalase-like domain
MPQSQDRGWRWRLTSASRRVTGEDLHWTVAVVTPQDDPMPCRIAVIALDAVRPQVVAQFWCQVLGWSVVAIDGDVVSIGPKDASWPAIDIIAVPEQKVVKNRLHLDLRADGTSTQLELQRLLELGARRIDVGQASDSSWVVLSDPEGNEFCLLSRSVQEVLADPVP